MPMEIVFGICLVLLVLMAIGHGLWELVAWLFRGCRPRRNRQADMRAGAELVCPRCSHVVGGLPCPFCGFSTAPADEMQVVLRVLERLVENGNLDRAVVGQVAQAQERSKHPVQIPVARLTPPPVPAAETARTVWAQQSLPSAVAGSAKGETAKQPLPSPRAAQQPAAGIPQAAAPIPMPIRKPRRDFADVLNAFMEQGNIRWGELVGGLLIVGFSIALVMSVWSAISERPMLKVAVFTAVVGGLFGLGLYADRKWKLPLTSRGILITAVLLTPLHFAAMVMIGGKEQAGALVLGIEAIAAGALGWLVYLASGVIGRHWRMALTAGVIATSLAGPVLYVMGLLQGIGSVGAVIGTGLVPVGVYLLMAGWAVWVIAQVRQWDEAKLRDAMCLMGLSVFAAAPSAAMQMWFGREVTLAWSAMAPIFALTGLPVLAGVGLMSRRIGTDLRRWQAGLFVVGAVAAAFVLAWVAVAWPVPVCLVLGSMAAAIVLGGCGWVMREAYLLVAAMMALAVGCLVALPVIMGRIGWTDASGTLIGAISSPGLGIEVLGIVALLLAAAALVKRRSADAAKCGGAMGLGLALLGLLHLSANVYARGMDVPWAWALYGAYGIGVVSAGVMLRNRFAGLAGTALLLLAGERIAGGGWNAWIISSLSLASACGVVGAGRYVLTGYRGRFAGSVLATDGAWWLGVLGALLICGRSVLVSYQTSAGFGWWLAGVSLLLLISQRGTAELAWAQATISAAAAFQVLAVVMRDATVSQLADVRVLMAMAITFAGLHCGWSIPRIVGRGKRLFAAPLTVDRVLGVLGAAGSMAILIACGFDAAGIELWRNSGQQMQATVILFGTGYPGGWIAMCVILAAALLEIYASAATLWLILAAAAAYGLSAVVAIRLAPSMAASGLRWSQIAVLSAFSLGIWFREPILAALRRNRLLLQDIPATDGTLTRAVVITMGALPVVGYTLLAAQAQMSGLGPMVRAGSVFAAVGATVSYIVPLGLLVVLLAGHAIRERSAILAGLAAATVHLTVTLAYLLQYGAATDADVVCLAQVNAIAAGACAWVWLLLQPWVDATPRVAVAVPVQALAGLCCAVGALMIGAMQAATWVAGTWGSVTDYVGSALGWCVVLISASLVWRLWRNRLGVAGIWMAILVIATMVACVLPRSIFGSWASFHTLLIGHVGGAWLIYFVGVEFARRGAFQSQAVVIDQALPSADLVDAQGRVQLAYQTRPADAGLGITGEAAVRVMAQVRKWGLVLIVLGSLFAVRATLGDPQRPWWSVGAFVTMAALGVLVAQREVRPGYLYPSAAAINLAVTLLWGSRFWQGSGKSVHDLVVLNVLTLAGSAMAGLALELMVFRHARKLPIGRPLHRVASWVCLIVCLAVSAGQLGDTQAIFHGRESLQLTAAAAFAVLALAVGCLWDAGMRETPWLIYVATISVLALALDAAALGGRELVQIGLTCGIGMSVAWGVVLRRWREIGDRLLRWGAARPEIGALARFNAAVGVGCLALILLHEVLLTVNQGTASMSGWLVIAVAALLLTATGSLIAVALQRITDPLGLPFARREAYVYLAEVVLGLLFLHVRLTCPWLFTGLLAQYWPIVVMVLAFVAAAIGEILSRQGVRVVAGPLWQTAMALPLAPALGYWAMGSHVDYALLLLLVAAFYGGIAAYRRSAALAMLAMLAANGALWTVMGNSDTFAITRHPQLWFIPPAACVMFASYLARGRLRESQLAAIRYGCLGTAYLASTSDVLLIGVGNAPWLAGVLGLLSVAGVMLGIALRMRSFLYMGTGFLVVSLLTLIYHATANLHQTWLIWLAGIALGVAILLAFALFEKKREQVVGVLETLKGWDA